MDYVGAGQVIKLEPRDVLVLSYLKSCEHETIVRAALSLIGAEHSDVQGGKVARTKVPCDGGKMQLTLAAGQRQRRQRVPASKRGISTRRLYALPPVVQIPRNMARPRTAP